MKPQIPSLDNVRQSIRSKIVEGYDKMGKLIEDGQVNPIYPENPGVDASMVAASTPEKTVTVNSELLRDLLNWAKNAEPGSVDNVVAKAEELGVTGPLGPEKLIDLTGSADYQQPGDATGVPAVPGTEVAPVGTQTTPGMPIPAGPVGPLSPVMASFIRRGKQVDEGFMDMFGGKKKEVPEKGLPHSDDEGEMRKKMDAAKQAAAKVAPTARMPAVKNEDNIIPNVAHEPVVTPDEMGKINPDVKPDGGQNPEGLALNDPLNSVGKGLKEDGLEDDDMAAEVGAELDAEAGVDGMDGPEIAPGGEDIGIIGVGPEVIGDVGDVGVAPIAAPAAKGGVVQQLSDLQARIAELEAIIKGDIAPEVAAITSEPVIGAEVGEVGDEEGEEVVEPIGDMDSVEGEEDEIENGEEGSEEDAEEDAEENEIAHEKGESEEDEEKEEK